MCLASELADGLEPHDHIYTAVPHRCSTPMTEEYRGAVGRVYPGWVAGWCREGTIPGTKPAGQIEAYLLNIEYNRFIRPFDWVLLYISKI